MLFSLTQLNEGSHIQTSLGDMSNKYIKLSFLCVCVAAVSAGRSSSGRSEDRAPSAEDQEAEPVSVKERLAMYQAAVSKKETSSSSSAAVRRYFHMGVTRDGGEDMQAARVTADSHRRGLRNVWMKLLHWQYSIAEVYGQISQIYFSPEYKSAVTERCPACGLLC